MDDRPLGRLERVEPGNVWKSERSDFTPWLAAPENLSRLGDALRLDLEPMAREQPVGPFRADLLCRDAATRSPVVIEAQLGRTDHLHLGQILTYAAGLDAAAVVWLAARFRDEHRAALDWLNRPGSGAARFFGVEIDVWKIGDSPAAPHFNVVAKPGDWPAPAAEAAPVRPRPVRRTVSWTSPPRPDGGGVSRRIAISG